MQTSTAFYKPVTSLKDDETDTLVAELVARARAAQHIAEGYDQARVDELVSAAGWAII